MKKLCFIAVLVCAQQLVGADKIWLLDDIMSQKTDFSWYSPEVLNTTLYGEKTAPLDLAFDCYKQDPVHYEGTVNGLVRAGAKDRKRYGAVQLVELFGGENSFVLEKLFATLTDADRKELFDEALKKAKKMEQQDIQFITYALKHAGNYINEPDRRKNTPLIKAVDDSNELLLGLLLECGVDAFVNELDKRNNTPLINAVTKGKEPIVRLLIRHGADVNKVGQFGYTPLGKAVVDNKTAIVKILLENKADVNKFDDYGSTALYHAIDKGNHELVKMLLIYGADVNQPDTYGQTALDQAKSKANKDIIKLLEEAQQSTHT